DRTVVLARANVELPERKTDPEVTRLDLGGLLIGCRGRIEVALALVGVPEGQVDLDVVGVGGGRLFQEAYRSFRVVAEQRVLRPDLITVEELAARRARERRERAVVRPSRLLRLSPLEVGLAQLRVRERELRILPDGRVQKLDRAGVVPLPELLHARG